MHWRHVVKVQVFWINLEMWEWKAVQKKEKRKKFGVLDVKQKLANRVDFNYFYYIKRLNNTIQFAIFFF